MSALDTEGLAEQFVEAFEEAARAQQIPLSCRICGNVVAHVNPPAPSVALTCPQCREVTR